MLVFSSGSTPRGVASPDREWPVLSQVGSLSTTAIIVPCYNEVHRLKGEAFLAFVRTHRDTIFIFVDDGSTDGTAELLAAMVRSEPGQCRRLTFDRNRGKGEAVRQGMLEAFATGASYVGYWDADLATPIDVIPRFVERLEQHADALAVIGARVHLAGGPGQRTYHRHYLGRLFATFASVVFPLPFSDTQCGAKVFRATPLVARAFAEPFIGRWIFDVELLARLMRDAGGDAGSRIQEYALTEWTHVGGSKVRVGDVFSSLWALARVRAAYRRD